MISCWFLLNAQSFASKYKPCTYFNKNSNIHISSITSLHHIQVIPLQIISFLNSWSEQKMQRKSTDHLAPHLQNEALQALPCGTEKHQQKQSVAIGYLANPYKSCITEHTTEHHLYMFALARANTKASWLPSIHCRSPTSRFVAPVIWLKPQAETSTTAATEYLLASKGLTLVWPRNMS